MTYHIKSIFRVSSRVLCFGAALTLLACGSSDTKSDTSVAPYSDDTAQLGRLIRTGDVVFQSAPASPSLHNTIASGQVGIASIRDGRWHVTRAIGGAVQAGVYATPLDEFLIPGQGASLYRPQLSPMAFETYQLFVAYHADRQTPYDIDYSLDTPDALYSTELVWRALRTATDKTDIAALTEWQGRPVINASALKASPYLVEVNTVAP